MIPHQLRKTGRASASLRESVSRYPADQQPRDAEVLLVNKLIGQLLNTQSQRKYIRKQKKTHQIPANIQHIFLVLLALLILWGMFPHRVQSGCKLAKLKFFVSISHRSEVVC